MLTTAGSQRAAHDPDAETGARRAPDAEQLTVSHEETGVAPVIVTRPESGQLAPIVIASPHSGRNYPPRMMARSALPLSVLRWSEDAFVDDLFAAAPALGLPLLAASFPRVFIDANRAPDELDASMFRDRPPEDAVRPTRRTASGLGVLPRIAADGRAIYSGRLPFEEATERLQDNYAPYHDALEAELEATRKAFGHSLLIDAHSMPSRGAGGVDIVIGDRHGEACHPDAVDRVEALLRDRGFVTVRNTPYAGGHTTERHGRPRLGRHAIQIEINRTLYMDERRLTPSAGYVSLKHEMSCFLKELIETDWTSALRR